MIHNPALQTSSRGLAGRRMLLLLLGFTLILILSLGAAAVAVVVALAEAPPAVTASVQDGAADLPLDTTFQVKPGGWEARVESVQLFETRIERDGRLGLERFVPLKVEVLSAGWQPGETTVAVRPADGPLRPDGSYRLVIGGSALVADLPWPRQEHVEREIRFTTPTAPRPLAAPQAARPRWGEPLRIRWSAPIQDFRFTVSPPARTQSGITATDPRESYVQIEEPEDGTTYRVAVTEARGANGMTLQHPAEYTLVTPVRPRLKETEESRTLEVGAPVALHWNLPVETMRYEITPPVESTWKRDPRDPTVTELRFEGMAQGETYELTVVEAQSREGAPLAEPRTFSFTTPSKLMIEDLDTGPSSSRVSVNTRPTLIFAEPIRNRRVAEAAISVEPSIGGRFEWLDDRQVRFIPTTRLPYDSTITLRVKPGPDGPRSVAGAFFERPAVMSFTTEVDKIIDVNVTRQVMTLIEEGRAVRTLPVATGVPGADTPIGEFNVQYKMRQARFRGTNVNGSRYDIGDVNWVLAFLGDYTIHGAYWRSAFGTPGSNGCVSLTDENARLVYDWAPEGTLVRIHY